MGYGKWRLKATLVKRIAGLILAAVLVFICIPESAYSSVEPSVLRIRQAFIDGQDLKVFFDIENIDGSQIKDVKIEEVSAVLGSEEYSPYMLEPFFKTDEGIAYVFLVDISLSLKKEQFEQIREAMLLWVQDIRESDQVALFTFGESVMYVQPFTNDKSDIIKTINSINPKDGLTRLHDAIIRATDILRFSKPGFPKRRVIVLLSDGEDDPGKIGIVTPEQVLKRIRNAGIPIYSVGVYPPPLTHEKQHFLKLMANYSMNSRGRFYMPDSDSFKQDFSEVKEGINNSWLAVFNHDGGYDDGSKVRLTMSMERAGKKLFDDIEVVFSTRTTRENDESVIESGMQEGFEAEREPYDDNADIVEYQGHSGFSFAGYALVIACIFLLILLTAGIILFLVLHKRNKSKNHKKNVQAVPGILYSNFRIYPENAQNIGMREEQQDAFGFSDIEDSSLMDKAGFLAVIADGMGGLAHGREAAVLAVKTLIDSFRNESGNGISSENLCEKFKEINREIFELSSEKGIAGQIGTTMCAAIIHKGMLHWASVGDSRIYLMSEGNLSQLSEDQIFARQLEKDVDSGLITAAEAMEHPERWHLTGYLGKDEMYEPSFSKKPVKLKNGDRIILCSDGLYNSLSDEEIKNVLLRKSYNLAEELVYSAIEKGYPNQDNTTCLIVYIDKAV